MTQVNPASTSAFGAIEEWKHATQRCDICNEILGATRSDGQIETAYILPCSHVFGNICISRVCNFSVNLSHPRLNPFQWLETDSQHQDCPNCRRRMLYSECGHIIKPCEVVLAPKCVEEKDMPEKCSSCRGGKVCEQELRMQNEERQAEENVLQGMKVHMPSVFGEMCRDTAGLDWRIADLRSYWKKEIDGMFGQVHDFEEVEERDQW